MLDKFSIASALREIALLLDLKDENPFKTRAYNIGADAVESVAEDLGRMIDEQRLTQVRGIGDALAGKIEELYRTGHSKMLDRLRKELPPGVIELSQIKGLSVKKIQALHDELKIESIEELEVAARAGRVSKIKGFGKKTEQNILDGIQQYKTREKAELLYDAIDISAQVRRHMQTASVISKAEITGAIRRWKETVNDISLVVETNDAAQAIGRLNTFPLTTNIEAQDNRCAARLASGMRVHLLCARPKNFASGILIETGSREHVDQLRELAENRGFHLSEDGLYKNGRRVSVSTEADIYNQLGLPYLPPELREGVGEIEAALNGDKFEDLLRIDDIQGMSHCHTYYSDGKNSVEDMALAAQRLGMQYITITDHSPAAHYAGGLTIDNLKRQWEEIEAAQEKVKIKILKGTESDILADGSLDYPDEILEQFDVIIGSVHSRMRMDEDEMTRRIINCMRKPQFKIWGHALGRLILRREPFKVRMDDVLDVIAESNAAIEINGDPYRLDMAPEYVREARKRGIKFVISVDAHSTGSLNYLKFGVHMARRGWLRKSEVLNALPTDKFMRAVKP